MQFILSAIAIIAAVFFIFISLSVRAPLSDRWVCLAIGNVWAAAALVILAQVQP